MYLFPINAVKGLIFYPSTGLGDSACLQISGKMLHQQVISESIPVLGCRMNWPRNHINLLPSQGVRVYCPHEREPQIASVLLTHGPASNRVRELDEEKR
ncbi:hypothetical protein TNCV_4703421 [Trichonephila clavipes]|nr:hypothetical protein TNCV_4703421 [Trichonephila clavipes]